MRVADIEVPKGCRRVYVDVEEGKVIVSYCSQTNDREFFCEVTGEKEERPGIGDFAIFWNKDSRGKASCANFDRMNGDLFIASDGFGYDEAVKFRCYEQFLKVRGIYGEE